MSAWYHNPNMISQSKTSKGNIAVYHIPLISHKSPLLLSRHLKLWIGNLMRRFLFVNRFFFIFSWRRPAHSLWNLYDKDRGEKDGLEGDSYAPHLHIPWCHSQPKPFLCLAWQVSNYWDYWNDSTKNIKISDNKCLC